jgi:5-formyltetrahydrofolate cyclo-ligase
MNHPDASKHAWRRHFQAALRQMTPAQQQEESAAILKAVLGSPAWLHARSVMIFAGMPGEPDLLPLLAESGQRRILFPRVTDHENPLVAHEVRSPRQLASATWGIREPDPAQCPVVDPHEIGLILVPGLGFGHDGSRIGRGKGCYDRFLTAASQAQTCGVAFTPQLVPSVPMELHDIPMQAIVSPWGWQRPQHRS